MKLKYMGPKPVISEHGISFKDGKDDKYRYIQDAIQIFNALNHTYVKGTIYKHQVENSNLSDDEIEDIMIKQNPQLKEIIENEIKNYKLHLETEIEDSVKTHPNLNKLELSAFQNNLKIMKDYKIQRAINKIYYFHIVELIANIIKSHKIRDISTPFNEHFWHILQTLQGQLSKTKDSIKTELHENENSTLELKIDIY